MRKRTSPIWELPKNEFIDWSQKTPWGGYFLILIAFNPFSPGEMSNTSSSPWEGVISSLKSARWKKRELLSEEMKPYPFFGSYH